MGIGASPFGRSRPPALLTSANILGGLFLALLGAKLTSIPFIIIWSWREESNLQPMVYKTIALPLSYASEICEAKFGAGERDRTVVTSLEG